MTLATVTGMFRASSSGNQLDAEFDLVADKLIDLEDGVLVDSTLSADLATSEIMVTVTVKTDDSVADAESLGFTYIERAINETVGLAVVKSTGRRAELVGA